MGIADLQDARPARKKAKADELRARQESVSENEGSEEIASAASSPSRGSAIYFLLLVALVEVSLEADRNIFSVALEPIKREFHLSDGQLGAINGLAFAIVFGFASIPIARLTGRYGHTKLIAACVAAWSAFTAVTAIASGFYTLFATRILVGVGEAGCNPALQSLIASRFSNQQRSAALSVWSASNYLGIVVGLALGGAFVERLGWRTAFLVMGGLGVLLAPLVWLTLNDGAVAQSPPRSLLSQLKEIACAGGMGHFLAMIGLMGLTSYATIAWTPSFYSRYYNMNVAQVGAWVGFIFGGGAVIGSLLGGLIIGWVVKKRWDATPSFIFWTTVVFTPLSIAAFLAPTSSTSMILLLMSVVIGGLPAGPIFATLHELVEPRNRAVAVASIFVASTVLGGIGPFLVGLISDISSGGDRQGLRIGLVVVNAMNIWTLVHMYRLLIHYRRRMSCFQRD